MIIRILEDDLYIGHWVDAKKAYDDKEDYEIFTVAANSRFESIEHYYPLVDGNHKENEKLLGFALWDLLLERIDSRKKILIHCAKGLSRAVTTCMLFMMVFKHYRFVDAYQHIEKLKTVVYQNEYLEELALDIERRLNNTILIEDLYGRRYCVNKQFQNWKKTSARMILISKTSYDIIEADVPYINVPDMLIKVQGSGRRDLNGVKDLRSIEQKYSLECVKLYAYPIKIAVVPITRTFDKYLCDLFCIDKKEKYEGTILGDSPSCLKIVIEDSEWQAWIRKDNLKSI